ncbi:TPA: hypothetical protein N0F65_011040, partial [Lagenidium giganteum]
MRIAFTVALTTSQTVELFRAKKPDGQSWHEHMLNPMAAKNATGASGALYLETIVDGASVHLVRDKHMLDDTLATDEGCALSDGSKLLVTHRGTAKIVATVDGVDRCITLANACYSPKVAVNLISMGTLLEKGCTLEKRNGRLAMLHSGQVMWYVQVKSRVLVVDRDGNGLRGGTRDVGKMVLNAVRDAATERPATTAKQAGTLRRAVPGIIIGKNDQTKGFRVYLPKQQMVKTTRHVSNVETLNESANERLQRALEEASDAELAELARDHETQRSQDESPQASAAVPAAAPALPTPTTSGPPATAPSPRRSQRRREESAKKRAAGDTTSGGDASSELRRRGPPLIAHVLAMSALGASRTELENLPDPKGYKATLAAPDSELWAAARQEELASIAANGTWS